MKAVLIYHNKIVTEEAITEMVMWALPNKTPDRPHAIKYRLYHGDKAGHCIIRYDNESGKGDHKHIGEKEISYTFVSIEQLMRDFINDVTHFTGKGGEDE